MCIFYYGGRLATGTGGLQVTFLLLIQFKNNHVVITVKYLTYVLCQ